MSRVIKTASQSNRLFALILCIETLMVIVVTMTTCPLPAFAVNCTRCGQEMNTNFLCYNPSCPSSVIYCIFPSTDTPNYPVPAATTLQPNAINLDSSCSGVTDGEPGAVGQDNRQAPPWLLHLSRQVERDEDNHPNIGEFISPVNLAYPQYSFHSIDEATTTLQHLLTVRRQHFIISYYFSVEEEEFEFHLAVAVDQARNIFVLSNINPEWPDAQPGEDTNPLDWRYATRATSNDVISALGLSDESFLPPEERIIVNYLAIPLRLIEPAKKQLKIIIEYDKSNLTE